MIRLAWETTLEVSTRRHYGVEKEEEEKVRIKVMKTRVYPKAAAEDKIPLYPEPRLLRLIAVFAGDAGSNLSCRRAI